MQSFYELTPANPKVREGVAALSRLDPDFLAIEAAAGPLTMLYLPPTFAALVRIVVGQQLSTRAARTIFERLSRAIELEPEALLAASDETLAAGGLSRAKIQACRNLADALLSGRLNLEALQTLSQPEVMAALTSIKGVGPWTAEIFMLFALQQLDVFPIGDLALRRAYAKLKGLETAPELKQLTEAVASLSPYRGVAALLLWHAYRLDTGFSKQPPSS